MNIYADVPLTPDQLTELTGRTGATILQPSASELDPAVPDHAFLDCEIAFGNPPAAWLPANPELRWVQLESVGFGEYLHLDWSELGRRIRMTNLAGFFADPVAETALGGILAHYRGLDELAICKAERRWLGDDLRPALGLLAGRDVVLVGRGSINKRLAELLAAFGCGLSHVERDTSAADLDRSIASADVVVAALPDTPRTRNLFDRRRLALLRADALFVNVGRGTVVDETALAQALTDGRLGGAVIDVTVDEPLPDDHPLWDAPRTLLTQHTAGGTSGEMAAKIHWFADNYARYCAGRDLHSVVDFTKGY